MLFNSPSDIRDVSGAIRDAVAPVFLLTGIGSILGVLVNRLGRAIDRARNLNGLSADQRKLFLDELDIIVMRTAWMRWSVGLFIFAGLCVSLAIAAIFVGVAINIHLSNFVAKEHPEQQFYAVTGVRGEEDFVDLRRVTTFKNRENVDGLVMAANADSKVRATDFRNAILSGNLDMIVDFFPAELKREEILKIVNMLKQSIIAEMMGDDLNKLMDSWFITEEVKEGSSGSPAAPQSIVRSDDRAKLTKVYDELSQLLDKEEFSVTFQNDHVRVAVNGPADKHNFDFTPYMGSILEYMLDQKMNITPLPEIKIKRDLVEASDFFGRTAYYDPNIKEIVLYTEGRHPKDVMRSFTHEMIHHIQNLEGRLSEVNTSDTNADDNLMELEKEAYLNGNITFRNWEDKVKKENK